jgi:hypothetical protein
MFRVYFLPFMGLTFIKKNKEAISSGLRIRGALLWCNGTTGETETTDRSRHRVRARPHTSLFDGKRCCGQT